MDNKGRVGKARHYNRQHEYGHHGVIVHPGINVGNCFTQCIIPEEDIIRKGDERNPTDWNYSQDMKGPKQTF